MLHVADLDEIPQTPLRIDPNGFINLPLVGRIQASGLTIEQLQQDLVLKLSKYVRSPDITINLTDMESRPVSVLGEVYTPGIHQLTGPTHLLDVLSFSGGLKADAGPVVMVTRDARVGGLDGGSVKLDPSTGMATATYSLDSLTKFKNPGQNILMRPGDVVSVPRGDLVYVVGDVKKAGGFMLSTHTTISVLQAVTLAEGLGPDSAAGSARILRPAPEEDGEHKIIVVDVKKIFDGKAPDIQLYANDILFVPHSGFKAGSRRAIEAAIGVTSGILIYR